MPRFCNANRLKKNYKCVIINNISNTGNMELKLNQMKRFHSMLIPDIVIKR